MGAAPWLPVGLDVLTATGAICIGLPDRQDELMPGG